MSLAVFEEVGLAYGKKTLMDGLNLRLGTDDRIGLIGPNGSGKTSLLRLLSGEQVPDYGTIRMARGTRLGYLPQDLAIEGGKGLLEFVRASVPGREQLDGDVAACEAELAEAEAKASGGDADTPDAQAELMEIVARLAELHERVTHYELHFTEHEAMRILTGLGFAQADKDRDLGELSGGWKMRAVLAALLFQKPDLLLLDEPTNHLDMPSVTWFSDFLKGYKHAFILICHDREFLNEQIRRIISFEPEGVRQYPGDYERYLEARAEEEIILENKAKNLAREREHTEKFINRFRAQANKAKAVQSRVKALDKMEDVVLFEKRKVMRFKFPATERTSAEPMRLLSVGKRYGERRVLDAVQLEVKRGEKIGIIGVNGAGKTTLLRMMAGEIPVTEGEIALGHNVKLGYYAQHHADSLRKDATIYEQVAELDEVGSMTRIRSILGAFLFSEDDVDKKIGVLSGGERARVALARLLVHPGTLLMMDEPTNHLDLASSEALAESLTTYDGTLVFVSHNRSFVRRLATRIWNVADGTVDTYPGTLDEYMDSCRLKQEADARQAGSVSTSSSASGAAAAGGQKRGTRAEEKERKRREAEARQTRSQSKDLQGEVTRLEARIAALEAEQKSRSELLSDPKVYGDAARSKELIAAYDAGKTELEKLSAAWEKALTLLEAAGAS
jgi:ATP-binding cassette subfamily F protein 3